MAIALFIGRCHSYPLVSLHNALCPPRVLAG